MTTLHADAGAVLARYPAPVRAGLVVRLENRGGFSGATLFCIDNPAGSLCLRGWPEGTARPEQLSWLHRLLGAARDSGLSFVPPVFETSDGRTSVWHAGRFWELQKWMPGRADYQARPSAARLENACVALARLHTVWHDSAAAVRTCPGVQRRLDGLRQWQATAAQLRGVHERAAAVLERWLPEVGPWLAPWAARTFPLQPCHGDLWHDHVLFEGNRVSGLIDYGAAKIDHVAVDLARMLGSLVADDDAAWRSGLAAYRSVRHLSDEEARLARFLDVSGTVLGVAHWLERIATEKRTPAEQVIVAGRLETLVRRMEGWGKDSPLAVLRSAASGKKI